MEFIKFKSDTKKDCIIIIINLCAVVLLIIHSNDFELIYLCFLLNLLSPTNHQMKAANDYNLYYIKWHR